MKIIKTKKYAQEFDPYKVDWNREKERAKGQDSESLFYALKDAIEASQVSSNAGKYFDQASVYRGELENRGISINEQNAILQKTKSLHTNR